MIRKMVKTLFIAKTKECDAVADTTGAIRETLEWLSGDTCSPAETAQGTLWVLCQPWQPSPGVLDKLGHLKWH